MNDSNYETKNILSQKIDYSIKSLQG